MVRGKAAVLLMRHRFNFMSISEAVRYGFSMIGYFIATGSASLLLILIAARMAAEDTNYSLFPAIILYGAGVLLLLSASYGAIYKLQSDSVMRGLIAAESVTNRNKSPAVQSQPSYSPRPPPPPLESIKEKVRQEKFELQAQQERENKEIDKWQKQLMENSEEPE